MPEIVALIVVFLVVAFVLAVIAAVWGWGHGRKYEQQYRKTMTALDEIAAEPGEAETWPKK